MRKFFRIRNKERLLRLGKMLNNFFQYSETGVNFRRSTYFYFRNEHDVSIMEISPLDSGYRIAGKDNLDDGGGKNIHKTHRIRLNSQIKHEDFLFKLYNFRTSFLPKLIPNDLVIVQGDYRGYVLVERIRRFFKLDSIHELNARKDDHNLLFNSINNVKFFSLTSLAEGQILFIRNSEKLSQEKMDQLLAHYQEYKNMTLVLHYSSRVNFGQFNLGETKFKYFQF